MSRIHEALKQAEQERAALAQPGTAGPMSVLDAATEVAEAPAPAREKIRELHPAAEDFGGVVTPALLEARCRKVRWTPEPKTTLLMSAENHVRGSEELRTLRSRLYQIRETEPLRTVLVTSALPADGKTFISANLGQIIVRQPHRRVLLIDADLRRSQMHHVLGAPASPGLTDYLQGHKNEFEIIQHGSADNLYFIPGGTEAPNPAELLANGRMKVLLERVAPAFDWVLVDSPPALPVADAAQLAGMCDGVLLVVHAGRTPFDLAQRARDEFRDRRILGVVLNRVSPQDAYNSYYYSGYYRYGYTKNREKER